MKKLYWFLGLFFLWFGATAQTRDTVSKDTAKRAVIINGNKDSKPLILIDGAVFKGNVNDLDPNNISEIHVFRNDNNAKIYGKAAANGIIKITTKGHESNDKYLLTDTSDRPERPDDARYVIDGALSDKKLDGVDPNDILSINVIKDNKNAVPMESSGTTATVIVVTKAGAAKSYQKKLSAFSTAYKGYLDSHNGDDSNLLYDIDGFDCDRGVDGITRLYKLPKEKIAKVKISTKGDVTTVAITTKK